MYHLSLNFGPKRCLNVVDCPYDKHFNILKEAKDEYDSIKNKFCFDKDNFIIPEFKNTKDIFAQKFLLEKAIKENDGKWRLSALFNLEGYLVPAKTFRMKNNMDGTSFNSKFFMEELSLCWGILDPKNNFDSFKGIISANENANSSRHKKYLKNKGFKEGYIITEAIVEYDSCERNQLNIFNNLSLKIAPKNKKWFLSDFVFAGWKD